MQVGKEKKRTVGIQYCSSLRVLLIQSKFRKASSADIHYMLFSVIRKQRSKNSCTTNLPNSGPR